MQIVNLHDYEKFLSPYCAIGHHDNINKIEQAYLKENKACLLFNKNYMDLHAYMKNNRRLKEDEAKFLFSQIVESVKHCHQNNVVVQEIKLKKFVFPDKNRFVFRLSSFSKFKII